MVWYKEFNSVFFISMSASLLAFAGVVFKYALRSKCSKCKMCCIEIERNVELEVEEHKMEIETQPATLSSPTKLSEQV